MAERRSLITDTKVRTTCKRGGHCGGLRSSYQHRGEDGGASLAVEGEGRCGWVLVASVKARAGWASATENEEGAVK